MKIQKYDMPILAEFFNSLNSDRLYSALINLGLKKYIESLDDNHCVFNKDILNIIGLDDLNKKNEQVSMVYRGKRGYVCQVQAAFCHD